MSSLFLPVHFLPLTTFTVTNLYLSRHLFAILQPAVGRLRLSIGLALPEEVGLDGQGSVRHCLEPVRFS